MEIINEIYQMMFIGSIVYLSYIMFKVVSKFITYVKTNDESSKFKSNNYNLIFSFCSITIIISYLI